MAPCACTSSGAGCGSSDDLSVGITDTGGVQLRDAAGVVIDAVGSSGLNAADGSRDGTGISDHDPPMVTLNLAGTSAPGDVSGNAPATLSLSLGRPVALGRFVVGKAADYTGTTVATVDSSAGDAQLSVLDPGGDHPGHLVNGAFSPAQPLQAAAGSAAFAPLRADNGPLALRAWSGPVANDQTTLAFRQTIGPEEGLRTGTDAKTLTFTLRTKQP
jgi:hypothetical protein